MAQQYYPAYNYDFNDTHGKVVLRSQYVKDDNLEVGREILLVSMEETEDYYDGFGCIVEITGFESAFKAGYVVVNTDHHQRRFGGKDA